MVDPIVNSVNTRCTPKKEKERLLLLLMINQKYHCRTPTDDSPVPTGARERETRRVDTSERVRVYDKKDKYSSYCANQPE